MFFLNDPARAGRVEGDRMNLPTLDQEHLAAEFLDCHGTVGEVSQLASLIAYVEQRGLDVRTQVLEECLLAAMTLLGRLHKPDSSLLSQERSRVLRRGWKALAPRSRA